MNPTNFGCPSDITRFSITDYRPNKALYVNVRNNNRFRAYLQNNSNTVRAELLKQYVKSANCDCEQRKNILQRYPFLSDPPIRSSIIPFNSSQLDRIEGGYSMLR